MQESNIGGGKCNRMLLIIISISLINRYFDVYDYQLSHCYNLYTICFFLRLKLSIRLINLDPSQILFLTSLATVDCNQEAKNIVDGNRDRTLFLLWQILFAFELRMVNFSSHFSWYFLYQSIYSLIYFSDPIHSHPYSLHSSILSYFSLLFSDFIFGTFSWSILTRYLERLLQCQAVRDGEGISNYYLSLHALSLLRDDVIFILSKLLVSSLLDDIYRHKINPQPHTFSLLFSVIIWTASQIQK